MKNQLCSQVKWVIKSLTFLTLTVLSISNTAIAKGQINQPNILLITVDDMNFDSVGAFGSAVENITPNIDEIAREGRLFEKAYVVASNCAPSRVAMQTGLYPQQSGARGFFYIDDKKVPSIASTLRDAGFYTGVINKSTDTNPSPRNEAYWDSRSGFSKVQKYSAKGYGEKSDEFFVKVKKSNKPFYLVVNIADPHKPNFNDKKATKKGADVHEPSRIYKSKEVVVPSFLPDIPAVRKDVRNYFNSVKRADDTVGEVMKSLEKSGLEKNTLVVFLSDHGMPFPFAKSSVYNNGLQTPMVMKWPEKIPAGSVESNIVSVVDLLPTFLDVAGLNLPVGQEYLGEALLSSDTKSLESRVAFGSFDENARGGPSPMRGVITKEWNYVFNAWSDGETQMQSATMSHQTYKAMNKAAKKDKELKARVDHFKFRSVEELCHLKTDPACVNNLIDDPKYAEVKQALRSKVREQMLKTNDYLIEAFDNKNDKEFLKKFMQTQRQQSMSRAKKLRWKRGNNIAGPTNSNKELQPSGS